MYRSIFKLIIKIKYFLDFFLNSFCELHILLPADVCLFIALEPIGDPRGEELPAFGLLSWATVCLLPLVGLPEPMLPDVTLA
jgi:hypothetical protein